MSAVSRHLRKWPRAHDKTIAAKQLQDTITDRLRAYNATQRRRKRLSWLSWIWRRA